MDYHNAFMPIDKALIDVVRGCTFDDFLLRPQCSVLERRDPTAIDLVLPVFRAHHAQAAIGVGQHGHRDPGADGDCAG